MKAEQALDNLPQNYRNERKELLDAGIKTWKKLKNLSESEVNILAQKGLSTPSNLKRLKGIALFVCDLGLAADEAALLMHSGVATISALASSTPQELFRNTGRLERLLRSSRNPVVNLTKASELIKKAKARQLRN